jgi:diacylglycerol kinase (ATP)
MGAKARKVLFIINPISGGKSKAHVPALIEQQLKGTGVDYTIVNTTRPLHATELAAQGAADGYDIVASVGGDGTVNEIVNGIMGTETALAIVPFGSGNGLARHLGLPLGIAEAIKFTSQGKFDKIDIGMLNGKPFANMAGVGFDALIGHLFATQKGRGFSTYIKTTLREFANYKPFTYTLHVEGQEPKSFKAFLISLANSTQYGNNAHIAPKADIRDGKLDICVMKPFPLYAMPAISVRLFAKSLDNSAYLDYHKASKCIIEREADGPIHLDGEPFFMGKKLELSVMPLGLKVLVK